MSGKRGVRYLKSMAFVYFVLATVPILFGAVQAWVWSFYATLVVSFFLVLLWRGKTIGFRPGKAFCLSIGLFMVWTLLQTFPLPPHSCFFNQPYHFEELGRLFPEEQLLSGWSAISCLPYHSLARWVFLLSLVLFYAILDHNLQSFRNIKNLTVLILIVGSMESFYGLYQALDPSEGVLWVDYIKEGEGYARGTFINRNHFAGFVEMVWPLCLAAIVGKTAGSDNMKSKGIKFLLIESDNIHRQILFSVLLVLMLLALVFSGSRAGIASAVMGLLLFSSIALSRKKTEKTGFALVVSGVLILVSAYGARIGFDRIVERFFQLQGDIPRFQFWKDSLLLFGNKPLGIGLANFENVFTPFNSVHSSGDRIVDHLHNDYLELLIETGWPGFFLLVGGFLYFMAKSFTLALKRDNKMGDLRFFIGVGALSGLCSIAFHSFFDFNLQIPSNCVYFVTLVALAHACLWKKGPLARERVRVGRKKKAEVEKGQRFTAHIEENSK